LAQYAAKQRNYYWQYERAAQEDATVIPATDIKTYPLKKDRISDRAAKDAGGNFGRLARYGVMSDYVRAMMTTSIRGVPAQEWLNFFKKHTRSN
jgi:hypothetical protein